MSPQHDQERSKWPSTKGSVSRALQAPDGFFEIRLGQWRTSSAFQFQLKAMRFAVMQMAPSPPEHGHPTALRASQCSLDSSCVARKYLPSRISFLLCLDRWSKRTRDRKSSDTHSSTTNSSQLTCLDSGRSLPPLASSAGNRSRASILQFSQSEFCCPVHNSFNFWLRWHQAFCVQLFPVKWFPQLLR